MLLQWVLLQNTEKDKGTESQGNIRHKVQANTASTAHFIRVTWVGREILGGNVYLISNIQFFAWKKFTCTVPNVETLSRDNPVANLFGNRRSATQILQVILGY